MRKMQGAENKDEGSIPTYVTEFLKQHTVFFGGGGEINWMILFASFLLTCLIKSVILFDKMRYIA